MRGVTAILGMKKENDKFLLKHLDNRLFLPNKKINEKKLAKFVLLNKKIVRKN
jgi:hypothetical protein